MVKVELKGLHTVRSHGRTYYYAWRGGPRILTEAKPGTPAFMAAYNEVIAQAREPDTRKFRWVVSDYQNKNFSGLAKNTQKVWAPWLGRITEYFGDLSTAQFNRQERIRPIIRSWRSRYQETPRAADTGMQVLSRILSHAVELGLIASNPCEGIKPLYKGSRAHIIWTDEDLEALKAACGSEIAHAVDLAAHTGLRVSDLIRLGWNDIGEDAIVLSTGKSNHKREAVIPLYDALREVLARIPRRSPTVLTSSNKRPWTRSGLASSFNKAKKKAKLAKRDLHFHDLRGTAATKFYVAGLSMRMIAEIMAWEEESVERIIYRYVHRGTAMQEAIRQLNKTGTGTKAVKTAVKTTSDKKG